MRTLDIANVKYRIVYMLENKHLKIIFTLVGRMVLTSTMFPSDLVTIALGKASFALTALESLSSALPRIPSPKRPPPVDDVVVVGVHSVKMPATQEAVLVIVEVIVEAVEEV